MFRRRRRLDCSSAAQSANRKVCFCAKSSSLWEKENSINPEEIDGNLVEKPHFIFNCFRAPSCAAAQLWLVVYLLDFTCLQ